MSEPATLPALRGARLLHSMLRVRDLDRAVDFYTRLLGMKMLRRQEFPYGRFTLVFLGYGPEETQTVLELTYNWDIAEYEPGNAYGHIAIGVEDVHEAVAELQAAGVPVIRPAGPLRGSPSEVIAFVADPDGYRVELIGGRAAPGLA